MKFEPPPNPRQRDGPAGLAQNAGRHLFLSSAASAGDAPEPGGDAAQCRRRDAGPLEELPPREIVVFRAVVHRFAPLPRRPVIGRGGH